MPKPVGVTRIKILCLAPGLTGSFLVNQSAQSRSANVMDLQGPVLHPRRGLMDFDRRHYGQLHPDCALRSVDRGPEHWLLPAHQRDRLCCHTDRISQRPRSWRQSCASHHLMFRGRWCRSSGVSWQLHSRRCTASNLRRALPRIRTSFPGATGLATSSLVEDTLRWPTSFSVQAATYA